jgi:hypothetical protein
MFIAALFHPGCPLLINGLRIFIYNGILLSHKEE